MEIRIKKNSMFRLLAVDFPEFTSLISSTFTGALKTREDLSIPLMG
jgi:hypothetical protein